MDYGTDQDGLLIKYKLTSYGHHTLGIECMGVLFVRIKVVLAVNQVCGDLTWSVRSSLLPFIMSYWK